jgi:hypothetical protein
MVSDYGEHSGVRKRGRVHDRGAAPKKRKPPHFKPPRGFGTEFESPLRLIHRFLTK